MAKDSPKVLITGASRGIGRAIALRLKEKNHEVIGTATSKLGIESLAKEGVIGIELDLNNKKSLEIYAREKLGLIKTNEIFFQIIKDDAQNN